MKQIQTSIVLLAVAGAFIAGCKKDDPLSAADSSALYEDAAESISAAMGDESGGAVEGFADLSNVAGGGTFSATLAKSGFTESVTAGTPVYDSVSGWWTVTIDRSRSNLMTSASIQRVYQYQFQKNGVPQKLRVDGSDTATTLKFKVVNGSGYFSGPRVKHHLTMVKGAWTAADIDKDTVTINSDTTCVRAGVDSIITRNMVRTFDHVLKITAMTNVRAPRFRPLRESYAVWRNHFAGAISGTVEGTFTATITFQRGDLYTDRTIDRTFTITLGGGDGDISIGGKRFGCDLGAGQKRP